MTSNLISLVAKNGYLSLINGVVGMKDKKGTAFKSKCKKAQNASH